MWIKVDGQASLDGELRIMVAKSQQSNGKQNFQFGEMRTVIVPIINQSQTIFFVPAIVKVELMHVKVFQFLKYEAENSWILKWQHIDLIWSNKYQGDSGGPLMMRVESRWLQLGIGKIYVKNLLNVIW